RSTAGHLSRRDGCGIFRGISQEPAPSVLGQEALGERDSCRGGGGYGAVRLGLSETRQSRLYPLNPPAYRMHHSRNCCAGPWPVAAVLLSNPYLIYVLDLWFE